MERIRHRGLEILLGLLLSAVLVAAVVLVWESFSGTFGNKVAVSAELSQAGDSLEEGDIVTYRNVIVGEVSSATGNLSGGAVANLRLDPAAARQIPAKVTAVAVPASLFGNTKIELLPGTDTKGPRLHNGSVIAADRSPAAESLQTALANAYTLLTSVHPARLDAALSALATALQGQGANVNTLIARADAYLRKLAPHLPELDDVITSLATVTDEIAKNAPSLLSSLRNTLVVAKGIVDERQAVENLLTIAPTAVDNANRLLNGRTVDNVVTILRDQAQVSAALADHPEALADTIGGFKSFADTFNKILSSGPYLKVNLLLTGVDFAALLNVSTGAKGTVFHSIVNPPEYTRADCPRYAGASGPNCPSSGNARSGQSQDAHVLTTGRDYGGSTSSIGSASEVRTIRAAASRITGLPISAIPDATDLLLGPLLRGTATVIR
ncbi:MAG: phospholipid/cholesterol/gamma-HCH transport system substrate-binding protein [Pseudonocardiales bacterium]|nr:phospholipid/cholesterol/gamma-HCH transport system substrate-binding protein [Pseudonocardiales bacterium]